MNVNVVIAGGGTAGHVGPALALARALEGCDVSFVGTRSGAESRLVPAAGYALDTVTVTGFDRSRPLGIIPAGLRAVGAVLAARSILKRRRAGVVVGMGGYVSLPASLAARSLRIPVVLHEQNIVLGLANRIGSRFAARVAVSFEDTLDDVGRRGVITGNPVPEDFVTYDVEGERTRGYEEFGLEPGRRTVLVFGGSQGARRLNHAALGLVSAWRERADRQVLHATGRAAYGDIARAVDDAGGGGALVYRVVPYVDRMVSAYAVADLAVCRGGATTVAELAATGTPAIIVPYPFHRDRQQELHGRALERAGAAFVLLDAEATPGRLAFEAERLLEDEDGLARMRKAAAGMGVPDAAHRLARVVKEVAA